MRPWSILAFILAAVSGAVLALFVSREREKSDDAREATSRETVESPAAQASSGAPAGEGDPVPDPKAWANKPGNPRAVDEFMELVHRGVWSGDAYRNAILKLSVPAVPWLIAEYRKIPEAEADKRLAVLGAIFELPHHEAFELCLEIVRDSPETDRYAEPGMPTPATRAVAELLNGWRYRGPLYDNRTIEMLRELEKRGMPDNVRAVVEKVDSRPHGYMNR
jgi:hypothetical protein